MFGFMMFAFAFAACVAFVRQPGRKLVFAVSPAQLRIDSEYAVRANNMEDY